MIATFVNTATVLIGSLLGLLIKKGIPERLSGALLKAIGLCTIIIGVSGALSGVNMIMMVICMALGVLIGEGLRLEDRLNARLEKLENRFRKNTGREEGPSISQAFITACIMFCIGAMTIVGSLEAGLTGDYDMIYTKSVLDLISSCILSASMGIGVLFSAAFVLVFQGGITLGAGALAPFLGDVVIAEMTCVGSVTIMAMGFNILGITKLKLINFLPAIFLPILLVPLAMHFGLFY